MIVNDIPASGVAVLSFAVLLFMEWSRSASLKSDVEGKEGSRAGTVQSSLTQSPRLLLVSQNIAASLQTTGLTKGVVSAILQIHFVANFPTTTSGVSGPISSSVRSVVEKRVDGKDISPLPFGATRRRSFGNRLLVSIGDDGEKIPYLLFLQRT